MPPTITLGFAPVNHRPFDAALRRGIDGDTVRIDQDVRLVSVDTPEKNLGGTPATAQATLERCRRRLQDGSYDMIGDGLRAHLLARLTPDAARRHLSAGARASEEFAAMRAARLRVDSHGRAKVAVIVAGEILDGNGRLLGYLTPWLTPPLPPRDDPRRKTFNLELVETGWGALFPIYPALPSDDDLQRAVRAAERAWAEGRGAWAEFGRDLLLAYEYRACLKLGARDDPDRPPVAPEDRVAAAFRRICVDVRSRTVLGPYGYHTIEPPYRLWVWREDLDEAREVLGLVC